MATYRFPSNVAEGNKPHVVFTTHRARYNSQANGINTVTTGNSVAMYLPAGHNISDILRYDTAATGITGNAFERVATGTGLSGEDLLEAAQKVAVEKAAELATAGIASIGGALGGTTGAGASALVSGGIVGNIAAEAQKLRQERLNPREFIMFSAPNIRQFGFNFTLIPSSEEEARSVPQIIKFFRKASYPELHTQGLIYTFPLAFNVRIVNSQGIIKMPEVVCIGTNITYNPNSISYFRNGNLPVEINLQLSFQELQPITSQLVDAGY